MPLPVSTIDVSIAPPGSAQTRAAIVQLRNVRKVYGEGPNAFTALHEVSLRVPRGSMVALVGRSGSGKSTLLNLIGAVDRPTAGQIRVGDDDLQVLTDAQLALFRRRRLGFVFQSFHLLPSLTVFDNVAIPWTLDHAMNAERREQIHALLARLGLDSHANRYPDELSGGQQQRAALARAVVHRPQLVLADEPTGNLDAQSGRVILDLLGELQREFAVSVVMATHSEEAADRCSDRILLEDGRVTEARGAIEMLT